MDDIVALPYGNVMKIKDMKNKRPVFCTELPSFMGGAFNDDDTNKKVKEQAGKIRARYEKKAGEWINEHGFLSCYLHGKLETDAGYDIINCLAGTLPKLEANDVVPCLVVLPDNKEVNAIVAVGKDEDNPDKCRALIVYPNDTKSLPNGFPA